MAKLPQYDEEIFQYADTELNIAVSGVVLDPAQAKYAIYPLQKVVGQVLGASAAPVANLVELGIGNGITVTETGLMIRIPRSAVQNLRGRYQHELSVLNQSGALDFIFTGELNIKQTNGRYA